MAKLLEARSLALEILDQPGTSVEELEANLAEVAWTNRWFGGLSSLTRHLTPLLSHECARILDIGTGDGRTLDAVRRWASRRGARWQMVGVERSRMLAGVSNGQSASWMGRVVADGTTLPFPSGSFDAVICLQVLHHLDDEDARRLLAEMTRTSRALVVASDLARRRVAYLGARALAATVWRNAITRHDGPLSVARSFTSKELGALGTEAGVPGGRVHAHGPFRLVLVGDAGEVT